jgi:ribosomal protein S18 acetylase RimI-like enzyme
VNWKIERIEGIDLNIDAVLRVYQRSGLGERRPISDRERMKTILRNSNLIVVCWLDGELLGLARSISDFAYVTYLSDIAVVREHQRSGIGRALMQATQEQAPAAKIVLLAAPAATEYYPHIGFRKHDSAWLLNP